MVEQLTIETDFDEILRENREMHIEMLNAVTRIQSAIMQMQSTLIDLTLTINDTNDLLTKINNKWTES